MKIIRESSEVQTAKTNGELQKVVLSQEANACTGECWDCDSCGGSVTH